MKILIADPPNIEAIKARFAIRPEDRVIFTYGDTIYNPGGHPIEQNPDLIAHEEVHTRQQGSDPAGWWERYLIDDSFRLNQEIEAYRVQYRKFKTMTRDRQAIALLAHNIAKVLSGHIYGNIIDYYEARQRIKS